MSLLLVISCILGLFLIRERTESDNLGFLKTEPPNDEDLFIGGDFTVITSPSVVFSLFIFNNNDMLIKAMKLLR